MDGELRRLAAAQHGVVTRAQASKAGLSDEQIQWKLDCGEWKSIFRGSVYRISAPEGFLTDVAAATLWSDGVASHRCAAAVWGMDVFDVHRGVEVTTERDLRHPSVKVYRVAALDPKVIRRRKGVAVTSPVRTILDLGHSAHREDVECAMDFCLRKEWTSWDELDRVVASAARRGSRGPAVLRRILQLRSENRVHTHSLLETRFLQLTRHARLPTPRLQFPISVDGRVVARADFAWPDANVVAETIGWGAHGKEYWQFERDSHRSNQISRLRRFTSFTFTWGDVHRDGERVSRTVAEALRIEWRAREVRRAIEDFARRISQDTPKDAAVA
jgi:hypothetical protein